MSQSQVSTSKIIFTLFHKLKDSSLTKAECAKIVAQTLNNGFSEKTLLSKYYQMNSLEEPDSFVLSESELPSDVLERFNKASNVKQKNSIDKVIKNELIVNYYKTIEGLQRDRHIEKNLRSNTARAIYNCIDKFGRLTEVKALSNKNNEEGVKYIYNFITSNHHEMDAFEDAKVNNSISAEEKEYLIQELNQNKKPKRRAEIKFQYDGTPFNEYMGLETSKNNELQSEIDALNNKISAFELENQKLNGKIEELEYLNMQMRNSLSEFLKLSKRTSLIFETNSCE
jgi:hypothetical protein